MFVSAQHVSSLLNPAGFKAARERAGKPSPPTRLLPLLLPPISRNKSLLLLACRQSNTISSTSAELSLLTFFDPHSHASDCRARETVAGHNMSNQFIGLTMLVTLSSPPGAQLRGIVSSVEPGKSLTLRHGTNPPRLPRLDNC
jgi:hypothetical protein